VISVHTGFWDWRNDGLIIFALVRGFETVEVLVTLDGALVGTDGGTRKWCLLRRSWGPSNNEARSHFISRQLYLVPWKGETRFQEFCVGLLPHGTIIEAGAKEIFQISCASLDQDLCDWSIVSTYIDIFSVCIQ